MAKPVEPEPEPPTPAELWDAITDYRAAEEARRLSYDAAVEARVRLVDALKRLGMVGFHL